MKILSYAKENISSFEKGGVSSNEIRFFEYEDKKYILKTPLMVGDNLSPFWTMMKNVFKYTFEKQNEHLADLYNVLKNNPHIPVASFVAADKDMMIYEYVEGESWDEDEFPRGKDNAYKLGQYVGYNHQIAHKKCGIIGAEDVNDFYAGVLLHMEECIKTHWNSNSIIDKNVRQYFDEIKRKKFISSKYSLMMVDICADQFLFENENILACVDLDAYVIGPVEWELSFLKTQVEDWDNFIKGYETYQSMPRFETSSKLFYFLMALNAYWDKQEMEEIVFGETRKVMKEMEEVLKKENSFVKSEIEGLSDLLWSMGARTIYPGGEKLVKWFNSPIPAFDNRKPMDILAEDGEEELYKHMNTIPC